MQKFLPFLRMTVLCAGKITQAEVDAVYNTPEAEACAKKEQGGLLALLEGSYKTNT